jgi:predicted hydrocarbon binding protein
MDLNSNKGLFYFKGLVYELTDLLFVTVLMRQKLEKRGSGYTLTTIGKEIQEIFSSLEDKYSTFFDVILIRDFDTNFLIT